MQNLLQYYQHIIVFLTREKEEQKEKMISYLGTMLKEKDTDEDFRIAKAMAKTEAKQYKEEIFKNLKYEKDMHEINLYRKEAIKRKEDIKKKQQEEDELFMKKKMETDLLYQMYEMEKSKKRQEALEIVAKNNRKLVVSSTGNISTLIYD